MDQYAVALPGGRSLALASRQLELIAIGLGYRGRTDRGGRDHLMVEALEMLPPPERAAAFGVVLLRFGHKLDIESASQYSGLRSWDVCRLEAAFCQALAAARGMRSAGVD